MHDFTIHFAITNLRSTTEQTPEASFFKPRRREFAPRRDFATVRPRPVF
jgi:hypothetical protein